MSDDSGVCRFSEVLASVLNDLHACLEDEHAQEISRLQELHGHVFSENAWLREHFEARGEPVESTEAIMASAGQAEERPEERQRPDEEMGASQVSATVQGHEAESSKPATLEIPRSEAPRTARLSVLSVCSQQEQKRDSVRRSINQPITTAFKWKPLRQDGARSQGHSPKASALLDAAAGAACAVAARPASATRNDANEPSASRSIQVLDPSEEHAGSAPSADMSGTADAPASNGVEAGELPNSMPNSKSNKKTIGFVFATNGTQDDSAAQTPCDSSRRDSSEPRSALAKKTSLENSVAVVPQPNGERRISATEEELHFYDVHSNWKAQGKKSRASSKGPALLAAQSTNMLDIYGDDHGEHDETEQTC